MSMWSTECRLLGTKVERDEYGVEREVTEGRKVFCNVFSMSDAAFYAAAAAGMHPEAVIQLRRAAYHGERRVEFDGATFRVERVDRSSPDFVRLTLTEGVGDRG